MLGQSVVQLGNFSIKEIAMKRVFTAFVVVVALCSAALSAQAPAAKSPIFGTWKLIPAKSTFSPGPPLKSQVARLEAVDGGMKVAADRVEADGNATHFEWTAKFDGKDYPVKGDAARDAVTVKKIDDYTLEITNKKAGKVTTTIKAVYAKDGKTRMETTTGIDAQGQRVNNMTAWERQ
jgi:hypothetical protein